MARTHYRTAVAAVATLLGGLAGCSRDKTASDVAAMNASNIQRLANIYAAHQNYKNGRGPNDEAEFRAFIKDFDPTKLTMMKIDPGNLDAVFTSERDGKPFKIRYKVGGGRGSVDAVVFEQTGKDGTKQVGFTGGKVENADDALYAQLWSGKGGVQPPAAPPLGDPAAKAGKGGRPAGPPPGAPTGPPGS
jgi:hypothetical protein